MVKAGWYYSQRSRQTIMFYGSREALEVRAGIEPAFEDLQH
jgi:hypothetical protein